MFIDRWDAILISIGLIWIVHKLSSAIDDLNLRVSGLESDMKDITGAQWDPDSEF